MSKDFTNVKYLVQNTRHFKAMTKRIWFLFQGI